MATKRHRVPQEIGVALLVLLATWLVGDYGRLHSAQEASRDEMLRIFRDPPSQYGPIDCWWWEGGHLSREKMRWELEELKSKGVSGTWFYPRFPNGDPLGSDPPYWSDKWWILTRFSMDEHRRLGLRNWISDWTAHQFFQDRIREESRSRKELIGRRLVVHEARPGSDGMVRLDVPGQEEILDASAYETRRGALRYASRTPIPRSEQSQQQFAWRAPGPGWVAVVVTAQPYDLNYLDKVVVNRFLALFLDRYRQEAPGALGSVLQAYGPDEMYLLMGNILYSPAVLTTIQSEKGYDFTPYLAGLFYDIGPKTDKIRCDYFDTMSGLLEQNFYKPIAQWLEQHGMRYVTIATWGRENLLEQTLHYGDFFRYMRWFNVTGNEDPGPSPVGQRKFIDSKLSSSIAHLNGRQRSAVCAYWGSGWGMSLEQNVAWTNENYAYGINEYNQHGGVYGLMGGWYEWVPPEVDFYQPYWRYWKSFADYIRRLSYIMSQGQHRADVALLYPLATLHASWHGDAASVSQTARQPAFTAPSAQAVQQKVSLDFSAAGRESAEKTLSLMRQIYYSGIDLDVIDHRSLESAAVEGGRLKVSGLEFRAIVLPPLTAIHMKTVSRIRDFYNAGGTVVAFGRLPDASAEYGRGDPDLRSMLQQIFGVRPDVEPATVEKNQNARGGRAFWIPADDAKVPEMIASAIVPDVSSAQPSVYHTHQRAADLDLYFVFNARPEARVVSARFRSVGEPEIWDPWTGNVEPIHRFQRTGETTTVRLDMDPYQGVVLAFTALPARLQIAEDNLASVAKVRTRTGEIEVQGYTAEGGARKARLAQGDKTYVAEATAAPPPSAIPLDGPFGFRLEPTMNNRWGDFRYPPSDVYIGAEARRFRYREESERTGTELGWQSRTFDDSGWPEVTYSYGPYWWHLGPFNEGEDAHALAGEPDVSKPYLINGKAYHWEPYTFSEKFGYPGNEVHSDFRQGSILGVSENFFVFDTSKEIPIAAHYLFTYVYAPEAGDFVFCFGGIPEKGNYGKNRHPIVFDVPSGREAWVNGIKVVSIASKQITDVRKIVHLKKGYNPVLLKLVQPRNKKMATYAVFQNSPPAAPDPFIPLLHWFIRPQKVHYDISPRPQQRIGWFRFLAPPGLKKMRINSDALDVKAWVDGVPAAVRSDEVVLAQPQRGVSEIALRVELKHGSYAGAAFPEPVAFQCSEGQIALGDWSQQGLATYSGVGVYSKTLVLDETHLKGKIVLDLGRVSTVAEVLINGKSAGARMTRPFQFDITNLVHSGSNQMEIKVANTLANHMSTYPTKFVFQGQTVSGLLGPVQLRFLSEVTLRAGAR